MPSVGDEVVTKPTLLAVPVERVAWLSDDIVEFEFEFGDWTRTWSGPEFALKLRLESGSGRPSWPATRSAGVGRAILRAGPYRLKDAARRASPGP